MKKITLMFFMSLLSLGAFAQGLPLEGFEGGVFPPADWIVLNNGNGMVQNWQLANGSDAQPTFAGSGAAYIGREQVTGLAEDWLITKPFVVPVNPELRFYSRLTIGGDDGGLYRVYMYTGTGAPTATTDPNFSMVEEWTELEINPLQTTYREIILPLEEATPGATIRLAFVMAADFADRWLIDNVRVISKCLDPEELTADNIGLDSAELSWGNPSGTDTWRVDVVLASATPTGVGEEYTGTLPYIADGLQEDTAYKYYVKAICDDGGESIWVGPFNFSTVGLGDSCTAPVPITSLPYSTTNNTGNFANNYDGAPGGEEGEGCATSNSYLTGDDVVYAYTPAASGVISIDVTNNIEYSGIFVYDDCDNIGVECIGGAVTSFEPEPLSIPELTVTGGQTYYFVISTWASPQTTPYTLTIQQVNCDPPVGLPVTNIGQTSASLSWTNPTGADSWEVVVQGVAAGLPMGSGIPATTNTNFQASTAAVLEPGTAYEYYVRAECADGTFSPWAGPYEFNTALCEVADQCTYSFILTDRWGNGWGGDSSMLVRQNGIVVATLGPTFEEGEGPVTVDVQLCHGVPFELYWESGGWDSGAMGVSIVNSFDQTLYMKPFEVGSPGTVLYTGNVDCLIPACVEPFVLDTSNPTTTTIDLSWDGPSTGQWEYFIAEAGEPGPTDETSGTPTTTNPTLGVGPLTPATNYEYYVRLICPDTNDESVWAGPYAFNSLACDTSEMCNFTVELTSENGWGYDGNTMTIYQSGVPVATVGDTFTWESDDMYTHTIQVPLCPDQPIEVVWNEEGWVDYDKGFTLYTPYMETVFTKPPGTGSQGTTIFTGLVSCDPPPCLKPLHLTASDPTISSVTLGWDEMGDATSWEVAVMTPGSPQPSGAGVVSATETFVANQLLTGEPLEPSTQYVFYVRANCGADGYSTWTGPFLFVTAAQNDNCDAAFTLPVNEGTTCIESLSGSLNGATSSGMTASCYWGDAPVDVWYQFTATAGTHVVALSDFDGGEAYTAIYEAGDECSALAEVYCDTANPIIVSGLTAGETYMVQIYLTYLETPNANTSFNICVSTPAPIDVDAETYTVEQIVQDVLVTSTCAQISNISWSTGTTFGEESNGIAYFEQGLSAFPIDKGVVLVSGEATRAGGPNIELGGLSNGFWQGDDDLFAYIQSLGIDPDLMNYNDATVLEFDFVPQSNHLKFPFIFASEEYGWYQCAYSDAFAFFLTGPGLPSDPNLPPNTINLAVVPETGDPVSVVTIRDAEFNSDCDSVNEAYFDNYFGTDGAGLDPASAALNFNGNTVKMIAEADVIEGETYHIKLVIADRNDNSLDSAVFIGPFDIGNVDLGEDLTVDAGNAPCAGTEVTMASNLDPEDYTFQWFIDDDSNPEADPSDSTPPALIEGETGENLIATESGFYTVRAQYSSTCEAIDTKYIEFHDAVEEISGDPQDLIDCNATGFATFDFTANTNAINNGATIPSPDFTITYHASEANAQADEEALPMTYENTTAELQVIYVRIENNANGCVGFKQFDLRVQDLTPDFALNEDLSICAGTSATLTVDAINFDPALVSYSWTLDGEAIGGNTSTLAASAGGVYEVTVNNSGCTAAQTVTVTVIPAPVPDDIADVFLCDKYTLPELTEGNSYYTGSMATGTQLAEGTVINTSQTIYVYAFDAAAPDCARENPFTITITNTPDVLVTQGCEDDEYVLEVNFDNDENGNNPDNVVFAWEDAAGTSLGTEQSIVVTNPGMYYVTVTPAGATADCPVVIETEVTETSCLIPRGISPDGDGDNDSFDLSILDVENLSIFNRYGQEVYTRSNYKNEWHGQAKDGNELPTGTYFYMIDRRNGENRTGWVYINREQ